MRRVVTGLALLAFLTGLPLALQAQLTTGLDESTLSAFRWRQVGPANMSGRVTDIEGIPSPSKTFFVASAAGGIWKTSNNGTTFRPLFQNERVVSMGDIAIAPSDTMTIWAGTGEEDSRNSISAGGGIYQSTDGGLTWTLKGLEATEVIARIVVHPTNPDRVWVAALGHIWDSNPERGLYRTDDGGETWELVKFISDKAGFVDLVIHPQNPDVLFASSWERVRGPYFLQSGGPGSALWKTTDGGDTWSQVGGDGWPTGMLGRIGIDISRSDPNIMYALIEAEATEEDSSPSGLYRSEDGGVTWEKKNTTNSRPFYYSQVRVHPTNPDRVYWSTINVSNDGGETVGNAAQGIHVDHHAIWMDPLDPERMVMGNDGGIGVTFDQGGNYIFPNTFAIGQFYEVSYGMEIPYSVCGGLQDNGSWCGPSRRQRGAITNYMWRTVGGGDGFFTLQDPENPEIVYSESQGGSMGRVNTATGDRMSLPKPSWKEEWLRWEDSILANEGASAARMQEFRRMQAEDSAKADLRWNWNTPMVLSPHDPTVVYAAANRVLKYTNRGEEVEVISPDLSYADAEKIRISTTTTGGITPDVTGAETFATIVTLAESPIARGLLYAGTDDGRAWMSVDDGGDWEELTGRFPGVPDGTWVRRIEASSHDANTFFVAFDGHRTNDFTPYVYLTEDGGRNFRSIAGDLPTGGPDFVHVVRQDPVNPDLLFVGTDVGLYVSTDKGGHWQRFMEGFPTVPVHDLKIHPRDHELIAATHGRSIWIVDIAPLQQLTDGVLASDFHLFEPKTGFQFGDAPVGGESTGHQFFEASSPPYGAEIVYRIGPDAEVPIPEPSAAAQGQRAQGPPGGARPGMAGGQGQGPQVQIIVLDEAGDTMQAAMAPGTPGIHRYQWNFRGQTPPPPAKTPAQVQDSLRSIEQMQHIVDSLVAEGQDRQMLERAMNMMISGNRQGLFGMFGGGGRPGGGAGDPSAFNERPGERFGGGGGGFGGGGNIMRDFMRMVRPLGGAGAF
ncbi:WD40/YVTN/BNR-like repeat-containing protein, partial [Gemmatimonadota bacterium]